MNFLKRWGLKKEKKQEQVEAPKQAEETASQPFEAEAKAIAAAETHYILLSTSQADMRLGHSVPYVGQLDDGHKILLVFDSYDRARTYVDKNGYEVLEGNYPIARLDKSGHEAQQLLAVLNHALHLGIRLVDYNPGSEEALGFPIAGFFELVGYEPQGLSLFMSKAQAEAIQQAGGDLPLRFNPLPILDFNNPYHISDQRAKEVLGHIFNFGETLGDMAETFVVQESLYENCYVADYLMTVCLPKARENAADKDLSYFQMVLKHVNLAIWVKLNDHHLFTLLDPASKSLLIRGEMTYLVYTELFKYMGKNGYQAVANKEAVLATMAEHGLKQLIVTDGPGPMTILDPSQFDQDSLALFDTTWAVAKSQAEK